MFYYVLKHPKEKDKDFEFFISPQEDRVNLLMKIKMKEKVWVSNLEKQYM